MKKFHHKLFIIYPFLMLVLIAYMIFNIAASQNTVTGLEPIPCIDPTKPVIQNFTFKLNLYIQGKKTALDPKIGHDPAQCLREIHTNDQSGLVYVQSSYNKIYTLADFFAAWRKPFSQNQIFNNYTDAYHSIAIYKDGQLIDTFGDTPLSADQTIEIIFK